MPWISLIPIALCFAFALQCEPGGDSMMSGPGIDGSDTEVSAAQRLEDYLSDSRYPVNSRPAREDTPTRLSEWPGLPPAKNDGARILDYAGEELKDGSLYLDVQVEVSEAGRYSFFTILRNAGGGRPLAVSMLTRDLPAGASRVRFEFYGLILREAAREDAAPSQYEVPGVGGERIPNDRELEELVAGQRSEPPAGRLALFEKVHTTSAYRPQDFTREIWDAPEKRARIAELEAEVRAEAEAAREE